MLTLELALLCLALAQAPTEAERKDRFWAAARQGDLAAVKALLAQGVDVNARHPSTATALWFAAEKGHLEVVRLLVEKGADVNVEISSFGETPLMGAAWKGHNEVVKLLLARNAAGADQVLGMVVMTGHLEVLRTLLAKGGLKPETLSSALAAAASGSRNDMVELLQKAGAKPAAESGFRVEPGILQTYSGVYQSREGMELSFTVKDGQLSGGNIFDDPLMWQAVDKTTFHPVAPYPATVTFLSEGGKTIGLALKQFGKDMSFRKVGEK